MFLWALGSWHCSCYLHSSECAKILSFFIMQPWYYRNCLHFPFFLLTNDLKFFGKWKRNTCFLSFVSFQGPFNSWIPPFSGILPQQQQAQVPGLSQFSLSALNRFAGRFPNQMPFPGWVSFAQGTQVGQLDPSQPQTPPQSHQGPNHVSRASPILFWGARTHVECENE